ncbi:DUF938 domain-containing protein, partial [Aestuariivirga sp.]|uniref:DUF938 domain-containing protein n=1 Tax=Aestuariivirga sp. TaxID=2650926 RepID=UPI0037846C68
ARGTVLEIGCGTGEHAVCFAAAMPTLTWLPTDPDPLSRVSTASWIGLRGLSNVLAPIGVDASSPSGIRWTFSEYPRKRRGWQARWPRS